VCSTGKSVNTLLVTPQGTDLVLSPITVNIEDLSEEDQRKYIKLQEYIKQEFLSGARKDRLGKVMMTQDFELPAIKVNNDKIEVITTVSKPETDLSMKITEISHKFEHAFSNQHSPVAKMIARLEKIEGKSSSFNFPNDSIPQLDSQGVLQTSLSAASGTSIETPMYGMPTGFYLGQTSLPESTPVRPPPGWSNRPVWRDDGCSRKRTSCE
jgi:hypothetical protein